MQLHRSRASGRIDEYLERSRAPVDGATEYVKFIGLTLFVRASRAPRIDTMQK